MLKNPYRLVFLPSETPKAAQLEDTFRHKGLRKKLVDEIRSKGISDELVLHAMNMVPGIFLWTTVSSDSRMSTRHSPSPPDRPFRNLTP